MTNSFYQKATMTNYTKKSILKLQNITLSFQKRQILENISFEINQGEIFGMLGPNGVGKSTIFNLITGLIKPDNGEIFIKDEKVNDYPIFLRTAKFTSHGRTVLER